jgi:outer membrane receptor protein involved in Fe transport
MFRFINVRIVLAALAVLLAVTGLQAQTTTGRLVGNVVDDTGAALPGVTVTISSTALIGGARIKITDIAGEFAFIGIAPGEYTVKVDLTGFISQERNEILVALGGSRSIIIEMPQGSFGGEIEVVAETPVVDPTQVNTAINFTDTYMQGAAIGSNNRSYQSMLGQAAGVQNAGGNPRVLGSTLGENAYYVDGANTTDPVTTTFGTNFTFDSIQEIQFQTSGYEAEYGNATGGIINLVTKSGGNQFSGTADIRYRDDSFQESGDHFDTSELDSQRQEVNLTLGGPLMRDKLWFFVAYQYVDSDFTPSGSPTTRTFTGNYPLAKLTWQLSPSWRVTGKYTGDPADIDNADASAFRTPEATEFQTQGADIYSAEINGVLSESLMWNTVISAYRSTLDVYPQTGDLESIGHFNDDTGVSSVNNIGQQYSNRDRDDITSNLTWFVDDLAGSHEFKGGVVYTDLNFTSANCNTGTAGGVRCEEDVPGNWFEDVEFGGNFPFVWWENFNTGTTKTTGSNATLFVQDAWRVMPNLTLKLGVRYDIAKYDTDDGTQIADLDKWQPRLGAAWDITGDAKNIQEHPARQLGPVHVPERAHPAELRAHRPRALEGLAVLLLLPWPSCRGVRTVVHRSRLRLEHGPRRLGSGWLESHPGERLRQRAKPDRPGSEGDVHRDLEPRV